MAEKEDLISRDMDSNSISMVDVLQDEHDFEQSVRAVLGGSDPKNCTYGKGYVKRQALYACLTCIPAETGGVGGLCLACSLACHEGHSLVELYTKRNFRCDCGNDRYEGNECSLIPDKVPLNEMNIYNHNFSGLYCSCNRPYPDPEETVPDEMIQCVICEDWFHGKHLNCAIPGADDFGEMICNLCTSKHPFLAYYSILKNTTSEVPANEVPIDVVSVIQGSSTESTGKACSDAGSCIIRSSPPTLKSGTLFLEDDWRKSLCRCTECLTMYTSKGLSFLLDPDDTVKSYEEMGKSLSGETCVSQYEQGLRALSRLDRTSQIEAILGYNHMKHGLMEFLKSFADNQQVVRAEDIRRFFDSLVQRPPNMQEPPNYCSK